MWQTPKNDKTTALQFHTREIESVYSMCRVQCGSMEGKALSFVLRTVGSKHHQKSARRVFTYVVGRRVGMNDTCHFRSI